MASGGSRRRVGKRHMRSLLLQLALSAAFIHAVHAEDSPAISALTPPRIPAGGAGFALTVTGSGFVEGAVVRWNASALDTFWVDSTQLSATVPAELIGTLGEATVSLLNSGGAQSVQVSFVIDLLVIPTLISVSPISAVRGTAPFTLA